MNYSDYFLVIPTYKPNNKFLELLYSLKSHGYVNIIVIDDGNNPKFEHFFSTATNDYNCIVLKNHKNFGKGRSIKSAFNYILTQCPTIKGAITLDCDGQHSLSCIDSVMQKLCNVDDHTLVIGARNFSISTMPKKNKVGNTITRILLKLLCGINVSDTKSGLRGFSRTLLNEFVDIPGERFEYEMNVLISTKEREIVITECPIETIYFKNKDESDFNPLLDSLKIYSILLKFSIASTLSYLIELLVFALFVWILKDILPALYIAIGTITSRTINTIVNFYLNKNAVFKRKNNSPRYILGYLALTFIVLVLSALSVNWVVSATNWNEIIVKIIIDTFLSIFCFFIQRDIIFRSKHDTSKSV